ncbi:MAG TPA: hypothetical protein VFI45_08295 [Candidatus Acidoferrum sp.]|nr:hypothetical protein [Candidatus Acidoferrum sp.]
MKKTPIGLALVVVFLVAPGGEAKKKSDPDRGMLEKMDAVPCGAKQKGLSGLGSFWASVGITDVHATEKLCPQYLVRTDQMDYRIRPMDLKHPLILPVGHEIVMKMKKDRMLVRVPDGDKKMREYEVVGMEPVAPPTSENASTKPASR